MCAVLNGVKCAVANGKCAVMTTSEHSLGRGWLDLEDPILGARWNEFVVFEIFIGLLFYIK